MLRTKPMVGEGLQALMEQGMRGLLVCSLVRECVYTVCHTTPYSVVRCVIACTQVCTTISTLKHQHKKHQNLYMRLRLCTNSIKISIPSSLSQCTLKLLNPGFTGGITASGGTPLAGGARGEGGRGQPGNPGSALIGVCEGGDS